MYYGLQPLGYLSGFCSEGTSIAEVVVCSCAECRARKPDSTLDPSANLNDVENRALEPQTNSTGPSASTARRHLATAWLAEKSRSQQNTGKAAVAAGS